MSMEMIYSQHAHELGMPTREERRGLGVSLYWLLVPPYIGTIIYLTLHLLISCGGIWWHRHQYVNKAHWFM